MMKIAEDDLADWLRLLLVDGLGSMTAQKLLRAFGLPYNILKQSHGTLASITSDRIATDLRAPPGDAFQKQMDLALAWLNSPENHVLTLDSPYYPQFLLSTADPPPLLYAKGRIDLLNGAANLAIVGSRNATAQGISNAEQFAHELAAGGMNIVSGLALGIDAAAHRGALAALAKNQVCGSTIAVIGTGCDIVYPARNRELAHQIAQEGVIVSEFHLGTPAMTANFPRRNRIISGLAQGVLVVEAALKSGSLITARQAAEQNREVFAIPGSIHSPLARGCHSLIRQGAKLVESAKDILEEIKPLLSVSAHSLCSAESSSATSCTSVESASVEVSDAAGTSDVQQRILTALGFDPCDLDTLAARTTLPIAVLSAELMMLELDGRVEKRPGNVFSQRVH
ncbi:DNA processing protein DprA [Ephemeroptericola cinctiostellae]|uniref:DNA processing protein DprA n=1 Tax=Ephemeroptericola cinctiostellae TaxID=2268024 RepID=A0A345D8J4_9BURK|nr:DNA-processing protein DprA [Ephemeroptericola cinctiostellae]AXF84682.1 DNA processing protein DprA [Ephemeroptericola cinctiostellae]